MLFSTYSEVFLIAIFFGIWFLLSFFNQFPPKIKKHFFKHFVTYDIFSLIPTWTFFAPNPKQSDTILLYRDLFVTSISSEMSKWATAHTTYSKKWWHTFFNPRRRIEKALVDFEQGIIEIDLREENKKEDAIVFSPHYLALLGIVEKIPPLKEISQKRQFCLIEIYPPISAVSNKIIFQSRFHNLA